MRKKLLLLELALIAVAALAGAGARLRWLEVRQRAAAVLSPTTQPLSLPADSPTLAPALPETQDYAHAVERLLFHPSRKPAPQLEAGAPKFMPELPVVYGVLNFGDGPTALMAAKSGGPRQVVRAGSTIGEYKLVSVSGESITLEWDGREITKALGDLFDRVHAPSDQPAALRTLVASVIPGRAPGVETSGRFRQCEEGDRSPAGTVSGGFKKVLYSSPSGQICRWVPVR